MELSAVGANDRMPAVQRHNAELIRFRDERKPIVLKLTDGSVIEGSVRWFDDHAICVVDANRDEITVFKHAILHYRARPAA